MCFIDKNQLTLKFNLSQQCLRKVASFGKRFTIGNLLDIHRLFWKVFDNKWNSDFLYWFEHGKTSPQSVYEAKLKARELYRQKRRDKPIGQRLIDVPRPPSQLELICLLSSRQHTDDTHTHQSANYSLRTSGTGRSSLKKRGSKWGCLPGQG